MSRKPPERRTEEDMAKQRARTQKSCYYCGLHLSVGDHSKCGEESHKDDKRRCTIGHTNYWTRSDRVFGYEEFLSVASDCKKVCEATGVDIRMEFDSAEPPIFTKDTIRFNGHGGEHCETFLVKRVDANDWAFCKTRHMPYDKCVTACLVILRDQLGFTISSDNGNEDKGITGFEEAEKLVKSVLEDK